MAACSRRGVRPGITASSISGGGCRADSEVGGSDCACAGGCTASEMQDTCPAPALGCCTGDWKALQSHRQLSGRGLQDTAMNGEAGQSPTGCLSPCHREHPREKLSRHRTTAASRSVRAMHGHAWPWVRRTAMHAPTCDPGLPPRLPAPGSASASSPAPTLPACASRLDRRRSRDLSRSHACSGSSSGASFAPLPALQRWGSPSTSLPPPGRAECGRQTGRCWPWRSPLHS